MKMRHFRYFTLLALVCGAMVLTTKNVASFEYQRIFEDVVNGAGKLIFTPCQIHDMQVARRLKQRKENQEWIDKKLAEEARHKALEGSPKWQQRQKRRQELLAQQGKPKQRELRFHDLSTLREQDNIEEELTLLREADERAKACGE